MFIDPWGLTHIKTEGGVIIYSEEYAAWERDGFDNVTYLEKTVNEDGSVSYNEAEEGDWTKTVLFTDCEMDINIIKDVPYKNQGDTLLCGAYSIAIALEILTGEDWDPERIYDDYVGRGFAPGHGMGNATTIAEHIIGMKYLEDTEYSVDTIVYNHGWYLEATNDDGGKYPLTFRYLAEQVSNGIPSILCVGNHFNVVFGTIEDCNSGNQIVICRDSNDYSIVYNYNDIRDREVTGFNKNK